MNRHTERTCTTVPCACNSVVNAREVIFGFSRIRARSQAATSPTNGLGRGRPVCRG